MLRNLLSLPSFLVLLCWTVCADVQVRNWSGTNVVVVVGTNSHVVPPGYHTIVAERSLGVACLGVTLEANGDAAVDVRDVVTITEVTSNYDWVLAGMAFGCAVFGLRWILSIVRGAGGYES